MPDDELNPVPVGPLNAEATGSKPPFMNLAIEKKPINNSRIYYNYSQLYNTCIKTSRFFHAGLIHKHIMNDIVPKIIDFAAF